MFRQRIFPGSTWSNYRQRWKSRCDRSSSSERHRTIRSEITLFGSRAEHRAVRLKNKAKHVSLSLSLFSCKTINDDRLKKILFFWKKNVSLWIKERPMERNINKKTEILSIFLRVCKSTMKKNFSSRPAVLSTKKNISKKLSVELNRNFRLKTTKRNKKMHRRELPTGQERRREREQTREPRNVSFWAGRPLKRTTSDLFIDRPRMANTIFTGSLERKTKSIFILPFALSGPNALWNQRYPSRDAIGDVGEGQASALRSLDVGYLTR